MLSLPELINVVIAVSVLVLESIARLIAYCIRFVIPDALTNSVLRLVSSYVPFKDAHSQDPVLNMDCARLIRYRGYPAELHTVETSDGFFITMFRIPSGRASLDKLPEHSEQKKHPVFFMHGFLQSSEAWVLRDSKGCLPFILADEGYDVWLGNVRGNRYGYKHRHFSPRSRQFWDFGMDEMARIDLPIQIEYAMKVSGACKMTYIGFSQGTAIAFAAFSVLPDLASKISLFVALAPSTRVHGLKNPIIESLVACDPNIVYLIFGRRRLLSLALFWRRILPPTMFSHVIDISTRLLFGWKSENLSPKEKPRLYAHLYSYGSVKTMVHWFQVIVNSRFQMYDDQDAVTKKKYPGHLPPLYPVSQIRCPVALFFGGSDPLPDTEWLLHEISEPVYVHCQEEYEHLDFQWAASAPKLVYPKIVELVHSHDSEMKR
jgi:lysosomal acid lipase/cholesteryl ester hydrolase